jgi:hypothetical protein
VIFVEVLDRRGRVMHRVRLDTLPATVGRGYGNAVILDDRYVSPEHARIAAGPDGGLVVEDLGSTNGLFSETGTDRVATLALTPGMVFRAGHSLLRVATGDQPVAPALPDPLAGLPTRPQRQSPWLPAAIMAALGLSMVESYLGSYGETSIAALVADALSLGLVLAAWSGAWALLTRITAQRFAFARHLALATAVLLGAEVVSLVANVGDLIEAGTAQYWVAESALYVGALAALLFGHLGVATPLAVRRRLAWSLGVAVALVGLDEFTDLAAGGHFERAPSFAGAVRPLAGSRGTPLDTFIAAAAELQRSVDAHADASDP